jgi:RHS repeat-associated protein
VQNAYDYSSFGEKYAANTSETIGQRYQYTGREASQVGAPMYYRYRTYFESLGVFGGRDLLGYDGNPEGNLYLYVSSRPVMTGDPYGLNPPNFPPYGNWHRRGKNREKTREDYEREKAEFYAKKRAEEKKAEESKPKRKCCGGKPKPHGRRWYCCGDTWIQLGAAHKECCLDGKVGKKTPYWKHNNYKTRGACIEDNTVQNMKYGVIGAVISKAGPKGYAIALALATTQAVDTCDSDVCVAKGSNK